MLVLEIFTLGLLTVSVLTGLIALISLLPHLTDFRAHDLPDIFRRVTPSNYREGVNRFEAWLFLVVSISTLISLIDLYLRFTWAIRIGWSSAGDVWGLRWLAFHCGLALFSIVVHRGAYYFGLLIRREPPNV